MLIHIKEYDRMKEESAMNKRFMVLFLVVALMLPMFAGCSNQSTEIKQKDEVVEAEAVDVKKVG